MTDNFKWISQLVVQSSSQLVSQSVSHLFGRLVASSNSFYLCHIHVLREVFLVFPLHCPNLMRSPVYYEPPALESLPNQNFVPLGQVLDDGTQIANVHTTHDHCKIFAINNNNLYRNKKFLPS